MKTDTRIFLASNSPFLARQGELKEPDQSIVCMSGMEECDGLELSLGLSLGGSFSKVETKDAVKQLGSYLDSQKASNSARRVIADGDTAMADQALRPDARICENTHHGSKPDQRKHEDAIYQSRDQVWQALQKNAAVSVLDPMHAEEAATAFQELKDASASLWSRRSASMQLMLSPKEGNEAASQSIRRSSSIGVLMSLMPQQSLHSSQAPLARHLSNLESRLEKSPEALTPCQQQQHEALELHRKKRLQAKRRQEARLRRKSLLEEKQHKKAKRDDMGLLPQARSSLCYSLQKNTLASATTEDPSLSHALGGGVQRLDGKQWEQTDMKSRTTDVSWVGNDNDQAEAQQKSNNHRKGMTECEELKGRKTNATDKGGGFTEEPVVEMEMCDSKVEMHQMFAGELGIPRAAKRKARYIGISQGAPPAPSIDVGNSVVKLNVSKDALGYGGKDSNSTSESETGDTKEHSSVQNESGELEASSRKSATETSQCLIGISSSFPSMVVAGNSLAYPSPFPVLPIPYPFPIRAASPAALPLQLGYTVPCFMQYPAPTSRENPTASSSQLPGSFSVPVGSSLTPYHLPLPEGGYFPWFPVVQAGATTQSAPQPDEANKSRAGLPINNHTSNEREGEHLEGRCAEKSSIIELSLPVVQTLQRSSSTSILKDQLLAQSLPLSKELDCQVSASVGMSSVMLERSAVEQNLPLERQQSLPPVGQSLSQQTRVLEQPILRPHMEGQTQPKGSESEHDPSGDYKLKNSVSMLKHLEGSADSHLASKSSCHNSNNHLGVVEGRKLGSMAELPWVSTTGVGPNGKTINGVMYISNTRQARIVCSCHGKHMSPAEFVQHSGSTDLSNPERNILVNPFPFLNQLGSTLV